jgi:Holliday junction DNA helicase RuvA
MIGRLRGTVIEKRPPMLLIDVNGVGYELEAPMSTFYGLPDLGREAVLYTHLVVREDAQQLYGFIKDSDRALFRQLLRVTGIGAKIGIGILSGMSAEAFVRCVEHNDSTALTRLPGVGKKTAERLIIELRDRLGNIGGGEFERHVKIAPQVADPVSDAISALVALGYKPQEASRWIGQIDTAGLKSEEIIRRALQLAAR